MHLNITLKDIKKALELGAFYTVYQPILANQSEKVAAYECLIRWEHPSLGNIPPDAFIPLAESSGLITEIDRWVIEKALEQIHSVPISVNVSVSTLEDPHFTDWISEMLKAYKVPSQTLILEITERVVQGDLNHIVSQIKKISALGVHISLDDFGSGYSSVACLIDLPIHSIKIDKSIIKNLEHPSKSVAFKAKTLIQGLVDTCRKINIATVAEGVENQSQRNHLKEINTHFVQGFYFDYPKKPALLGPLNL